MDPWNEGMKVTLLCPCHTGQLATVLRDMEENVYVLLPSNGDLVIGKQYCRRTSDYSVETCTRNCRCDDAVVHIEYWYGSQVKWNNEWYCCKFAGNCKFVGV